MCVQYVYFNSFTRRPSYHSQSRIHSSVDGEHHSPNMYCLIKCEVMSVLGVQRLLCIDVLCIVGVI